MMLDRGEICGGFAHAYEARILGASDTPMVRTIEGIVDVDRGDTMLVEVTTDDGKTWTEAFSRRFDPASEPCLFTTPNPYVLGVRIRGVALAVDVSQPTSRWNYRRCRFGLQHRIWLVVVCS